MLSLLFLGNTNNINVTRAYPGFSFLNTIEMSMSLLNIGLSGLSLQSVVEVGNKFLMNEICVGILSIKLVRQVVNDYDKELPLPINTLNRCMMLAINIRIYETNDNTYQVN